MLLHVLCLAAATLAADSEEDRRLAWGDLAPPLAVEAFVRGQPLESFESGTVYVVEFWATWCEPCLETIPHLSRLQRRYPAVDFVGVSTDEDIDDVRPFVRGMGHKMNYRVAVEARSSDEDEGRMSRDWLEAFGIEEIPTAFIVDGQGRVAWTGHPADLEKPLAAIVSGDWDIAVEAAAREARLAAAQLAEEASAGLYIALARRDFSAALELIDRQIAADPTTEAEQGTLKFWILNQLADRAAAAAYGERLLKTADEDDVVRYTEIAGIVACPDDYAIGDYAGFEADDELDLDAMPDENEEAEDDADDEDTEEEAAEDAGQEGAAPDDAGEVPSDVSEKQPAAQELDAEPATLPQAGEQDELSMEDDDLADLNDPLLRLAMRAGRRAVEAAEQLGHLEQRAEAARVLAKACAAANRQAEGQDVLQAALDDLRDSIERRQSLAEQLESELDRAD
ncbi:MAG: TlpA family protein disulfide reductase [Pirellulales bacterium]